MLSKSFLQTLRAMLALLVFFFLFSSYAITQQSYPGSSPLIAADQKVEQLQSAVAELEAEVSELKAQMAVMRAALSGSDAAKPAISNTAPHLVADVYEPAGGRATDSFNSAQNEQPTQAPPPANSLALSAEDRGILDYLKGTTTNVMVDAYYSYNFNNPVGRANALRAYDVLSNAFSLNQAAVVFERAADPSSGRRWGTRLDLQFGQATATLQESPSNEHRPNIYRNMDTAGGRASEPAEVRSDAGPDRAATDTDGIGGSWSSQQRNPSITWLG